MVVKAKAPGESAEQKAARERAEARAEKAQIGEIRRGVTQETAALLRRFGVRAAQSGSPTAGANIAQAFTGFGGITPGGARTAGSYVPSVPNVSRGGFGNIGAF